MTKEHPTGSFLDLANRLEIREAWFHIMERGGLKNAGASTFTDYHGVKELHTKLHLYKDSGTTAAEYCTQSFSISGFTNNREGYPVEIRMTLIDRHSHVVNINYFTRQQGHVSIQTNLLALEEQINSELQKAVLTRIANEYGV